MKTLLVVCALLAVSANGYAQQADVRFDAPADTTREINRTWSLKRVAKWGTLLASTGAVVYGFTENRSADREYEAIEKLCDESPSACATKTGSTEYVDAALEARYQSVLKRDDRAKLALLGGQAGLLASVVLFLIDLPKGSAPDDIPYEPRSFRVGMRNHHLEMIFHVAVK